ncbi:unnamed protein product [Kuraishia capsulata CBS 1993]|uniref:Pre-mRNA-splicing factor ini1 n=1 Tax=Kuraishia capsulata CBS 1993 TaxID=1382522 RepID=W6MII2_9ASCO|nr:uncharacterized protein KUCA_T00001927001 [Kuraishia capsulata CBS 1993]CDK25956.1 unnamed protein product [Kuraishia capsulata CBS 1993]
MSRAQFDLVMCLKQPGTTIGKVCERCDGRCPGCDSLVNSKKMARICDDCSFGNFADRCIICGGKGFTEAYYCSECVRTEKDRDGCPKVTSLGSSRVDMFYEKKKKGQ